jgi:hypothetical protein
LSVAAAQTIKQTNTQKFKVWLRQGSKVETSKHAGVKTPFPIHQPPQQQLEQSPKVVGEWPDCPL